MLFGEALQVAAEPNTAGVVGVIIGALVTVISGGFLMIRTVLTSVNENAVERAAIEGDVAKTKERETSKRILIEQGVYKELYKETLEKVAQLETARDTLQQRLEASEYEKSMIDRANAGLSAHLEGVEELGAEHKSCLELVSSLRTSLAVCETEHRNAKAHAAWLERRLDKLDGGPDGNPSIPPAPAPEVHTPSADPAALVVESEH